ncbi:hypothetical protein LX32DRAFT_592412 [Colletotrichum zoysiae]|uniref:Uncharacterized protein n=1 Tax=Colletotrichum zoysiae TaxID=1216348 RepID=A0AAD9M0I1_9PEZI|nr:hypothetical protein LX32DRAFT_592412 [Colletotrichum zoysiae]
MWRLFRPRAGAASASTLAARAIAPKVPGKQTVVIQRVKISRPIFRPRTFFLGVGISLVCWQVYYSVVLNPFFRHVDREYESLSTAEKKELDEELDEEAEPWFIPFPFTTKSVTQPPYKSSDPEWQQYVQLSKDSKAQFQIRNQLAHIVKGAVERAPAITSRGGNQVKIMRWWLNMDFPSRPPPVFYSSGLLVQDDGIYWSRQEVDSFTVKRLEKILWPQAMAVSTWAFTSTLVKQHVTGMSRALGFEFIKPAQPFPPIRSGNVQAKTEGPLPSANRQTPDGTPAENASHNVSKTADPRQTDDGESGGKTNFVRDAAISQVQGMKHITAGPVREFWKKLSQTWSPPVQYAPRGCVLVSGFVEFDMPKAVAVIDVWGFWNPRTKKFDSGLTFMGLRRFRLKRQEPLRA